MENDKTGSNEQVEQTKDSMRTSSVTIPSPFPEAGDGSGFTTYSNINKAKETLTPELTPFDPEFGTDDSINTPRRYAEENTVQEPLVLKTGKTPFDIEYGTDENEETKKEAKAKEIKANEDLNKGFDPNAKFSKEGQKFVSYEMLVSENAKLEEQNKALMEQNKLMMERMNNLDAKYNMLLVVLTQGMPNPTAVGTVPYNQDPALAAALDPNRVRPVNPLEQAQAPLIKDINATQAEFAKQVQLEDIKNNPLNPMHASHVPPVPETTSAASSETEQDEAKAKRDSRRKLIICGVVGGTAGLAAGVLGGAAVAGPVLIGSAVVSGLAGGLKYLGEKKRDSFAKKMDAATSQDEKNKLEQKKNKWEKVVKWTDRTLAFVGGVFGGSALGFGISKLFMGGHGLLNAGLGKEGKTIGDSLGRTNLGSDGKEGKTIGDHLGKTSLGQSLESRQLPGEPNGVFDSGLIKDGRLNLPGDVSNGNLATGPIGNLPGGELNPNNFAGGPSDMGVWRLEQYLNANHITKDSFAAAGGDVHRAAFALSDPAKSVQDVISQFGGK